MLEFCNKGNKNIGFLIQILEKREYLKVDNIPEYCSIFISQLKSYDTFSSRLMKYTLSRLRVELNDYISALKTLHTDGSLVALEIIMPSNVTTKLK